MGIPYAGWLYPFLGIGVIVIIAATVILLLGA